MLALGPGKPSRNGHRKGKQNTWTIRRGRESLLVSTGSNGAKSVGEIFLGSIELANYFLPVKSSSSLRNHHSSLGGVRGEGFL